MRSGRADTAPPTKDDSAMGGSRCDPGDGVDGVGGADSVAGASVVDTWGYELSGASGCGDCEGARGVCGQYDEEEGAGDDVA